MRPPSALLRRPSLWLLFTLLLPGALLAEPAPAPAPLPAGLWRSDGYGNLLEIRGDKFQLYEVTAGSCLPAESGAVKNGELVFDFVGAATFTAGPEPGTRRLSSPGAASSVIYRPAGSKPAACDAPAPTSALASFDLFCATFAEHYPFFAERHVDWPAACARERERVSETTTVPELFEILRAMIEPLGDAHTGVGSPELQLRFHGWRETTVSPLGHRAVTPEERQKEQETIARTRQIAESYLSGPPQTFCNDHLRFGRLRSDNQPGKIGYLAVDSFFGYAEGDYAVLEPALAAALDTIFGSGEPLAGLVIDVRINGGGADPLGLAIAARLTARDYLAYTKEAVLATTPALRWTPGQPSEVKSSPRPHFHGPVALLTGPRTVSAGETFTMALLPREPRVTRVGESTQGVFADVLGRHLPDGLRFGLPNERFLTPDGRTFDGPGVPPEVAVPVFPPEDLEKGRDGALEEAIVLLAK